MLNRRGFEELLERELERARGEIARMRERADRIEERMNDEIENVRRSLRAEIVPYGAYESIERLPARSPTGRPKGSGGRKARRVSIPIERQRRGGRGS